MINMNEIAVAVTLAEGKKKSLSIAQVKEVLRCLRGLCQNGDVWSAVQNYLRYEKKDQLAKPKKAKAKAKKKRV